MLLLSSLSPCLFVPVGKKSCSFLLIYFHLCAIIVWISIWNIFSFFLVSFYRGGFLALSLIPKPEGGLSFFCHGSPFLRWLSFRVNRCPSNQVWNQSFPYPKTGLLGLWLQAPSARTGWFKSTSQVASHIQNLSWQHCSQHACLGDAILWHCYLGAI